MIEGMSLDRDNTLDLKVMNLETDEIYNLEVIDNPEISFIEEPNICDVFRRIYDKEVINNLKSYGIKYRVEDMATKVFNIINEVLNKANSEKYQEVEKVIGKEYLGVIRKFK